VLGHEVGHAIAKHANERLSQQQLVQYGGAAVSVATGGASSTMQTVAATVYGLGTEVGVMLPFNRKQELEADHLGLVLMAIAGYDANAAIPFWERMSQQGAGTMEFLSTHPSDARRINEIRQEIPEALEYYNAVWGKKTTTSPTQNKTTTDEDWHF
jgi:predicted Zn-dependent protease